MSVSHLTDPSNVNRFDLYVHDVSANNVSASTMNVSNLSSNALQTNSLVLGVSGTPVGYVPTALTLYESQSGTTTYSGCFVPPIAASYKISILNNVVTFTLSSAIGTGTNTTPALDVDFDVPALYRSSDIVRTPVIIRNGGVEGVGIFELDTNGDVFIEAAANINGADSGLGSSVTVSWTIL
jgi:hypothetical protein